MRPCIMLDMEWSQYVKQVMGRCNQSDAAELTGVDQTTLSRWLNQGSSGRISTQAVARFARGFNRPVLEAFVIAGFITAEEAGQAVDFLEVKIWTIPLPDLLDELERRQITLTINNTSLMRERSRRDSA